jgi:single-strand DNA-binding protein
MEALVQMPGHVGTEVDIRGNGSVTAFRLACTPRVRSKDGEYSDGNTTWIDVTCFRSLAAHVAASVRKGDPVIVIGKLRTSVWTKDGQMRERLGLEAETVGHDLSRGTAIFRRSVRQSAEPTDSDAPPEDFEQAGLSAEERRAQAEEAAARAEEAGRSVRAA